MTLVDTWASTAAGAFALSENSLYTVEAFREYFEHLKPDGMIAITRWEFQQPREALRVVSVAMQALHELGVANPASNFIVVSEGRPRRGRNPGRRAGQADAPSRLRKTEPVQDISRHIPDCFVSRSIHAHTVAGQRNTIPPARILYPADPDAIRTNAMRYNVDRR